MDDLAPVSMADGGLGLGEDWCWCQMFSPEPVQDSDTDWTPPTLLLLPRSLGTPVAVSATQITLHSLTLVTTITGILSPDSQVRVTPVTGYARSLSPQLTVICSVVSGVRAGRAVTACAAQSARPVLEISAGHVTIADPRLSPPSVLVFTTPS